MDFTSPYFPAAWVTSLKDASVPSLQDLADALLQELKWPEWVRFYSKPSLAVVALSAWTEARGLPKGVMWMAPGTGRPFQSASPQAGVAILRGDWAPLKETMLAAQEEVRERGQILVLDESATGFRLARGGAREYFGLEPDAAIYGSALAGGLGFTALAGRGKPPEQPASTPSPEALAAAAAILPRAAAGLSQHLADLGRILGLGLDYFSRTAGVDGQVEREGPLALPRLRGKRLWAFMELAKEEGLNLGPLVMLDPGLELSSAQELIWPRLARAFARLKILPEGEKAPLGWRDAGQRLSCPQVDEMLKDINLGQD
ncbi:MAG: aminotransferase class III-fold pyridoxal phosphate-dependent enzyme [Desulfarculaceae bacterium]